jgi:hypothetical protein
LEILQDSGSTPRQKVAARLTKIEKSILQGCLDEVAACVPQTGRSPALQSSNQVPQKFSVRKFLQSAMCLMICSRIVLEPWCVGNSISGSRLQATVHCACADDAMSPRKFACVALLSESTACP